MKNSMIVFLINDSVRAVEGIYEDGGKRTLFKTMDPFIQVDDLVVVQTNTRHEMTVVKITAVDVDVDFESSIDPIWVVQKVDTEHFDKVLKQEQEAITAVQTAERRRKREELRASLFKDHEERIKSLSLAHEKEDPVTE